MGRSWPVPASARRGRDRRPGPRDRRRDGAARSPSTASTRPDDRPRPAPRCRVRRRFGDPETQACCRGCARTWSTYFLAAREPGPRQRQRQFGEDSAVTLVLASASRPPPRAVRSAAWRRRRNWPSDRRAADAEGPIVTDGRMLNVTRLGRRHRGAPMATNSRRSPSTESRSARRGRRAVERVQADQRSHQYVAATDAAADLGAPRQQVGDSGDAGADRGHRRPSPLVRSSSAPEQHGEDPAPAGRALEEHPFQGAVDRHHRDPEIVTEFCTNAEVR